MSKTPTIKENLRYDDIENEDFEILLDEEFLDIENFLNSYIVKEVDEENVDLTIDKLRHYMPQNKNEEIIKNENMNLYSKVSTSMGLLKMQFKIFNKLYLIASIILVLCGVIGTIKLNLNPYLCAYTVSPIPILIGLAEILRGKEENMWELELSYKYSFREILFAKLVIISTTAIALTLVTSLILTGTYSEVSLLRIINICLIPTCFISLISLILASIYRGMNSIVLSTSIWMVVSNMVDNHTINYIVNVKNYKLFLVLILLFGLTIIASKLFYKKSINFIDYKNLDF
ncbi:putative membrane protein [[Clostridium] bifermentans ATCC 19299]|uniref:hypothetical protein n=1 Tax=Paraclostridium bifermentans TaxID=1490 RepID=UPI00038C661F|nr:hypothetical protein [Paraclostridium bifermentans]EQK41746.1 putative membrane protein [[Clostridium] bifermentans ATCC 19299] [Paraclostridium bifermentans ATCC 19299]MDO7205977.1 hypothetical protein [Paraclostridium bifermentans]MDV8114395.1 hypothetical protein [Bacillus sp. BAU-SS-2023]UOW69219.1 hypothetical protein MTR78_07235 [Paraclostridium bifermentans]